MLILRHAVIVLVVVMMASCAKLEQFTNIANNTDMKKSLFVISSLEESILHMGISSALLNLILPI